MPLLHGRLIAPRSNSVFIVHQLIEAPVERTPDAVALVSPEQHPTYRQLNSVANFSTHFRTTEPAASASTASNTRSLAAGGPTSDHSCAAGQPRLGALHVGVHWQT